uniref:Uncharacterized protein n=1 Tax=Panagrolaimus davidi TaxID=227884 RepID=A0A914PHU6_9BILA
MDSPKFEIPISLHWLVSKAEIQKEFQHESSLKKSIELSQLSGISYYLSISKSKDDQIFIGLGFSMKEETIINAKFKISINPANKFNGKFEESVFGKENGYEKANILCSSHDFLGPAKNYFIGGYIYLKMEGILSVEKEQIPAEIDIKSPDNLGEIFMFQ